MNSEIEFMIIPAVQIKGVVFFDMGNGYNLESKYCTSAAATSALPEVFNPCSHYPTFQNLRYSVGFGFRWFSPIGPLRFEWVFRSTNRPAKTRWSSSSPSVTSSKHARG